METLADSVKKDLTLPPLTLPEGDSDSPTPVRVEFRVTFLHIGEVNTVEGYVDLKLFVHYYWRDPRLMEINDNPPMLVRPGDDVWRGEFIAQGHILNPIDLRGFPFDYDDVQINIDTFQYAQDITELSMHPIEHYADQDTFYNCLGFANWFDPRSMTEWAMCNLEMKRKELEYDMVVPQVQVEFWIVRFSYYYLAKIVTLLFGASLLSFSSVFMDIFEDYTDRMNFIATMFLATSALLYVVASDLPKVSYLTSLDRVTMATFLMIFTLGIESMIMRLIAFADNSVSDEEVGRFDQYALGVICCGFTVVNILLVGIPWIKHNNLLRKYNPKTVDDIILGKGGVVNTDIQKVAMGDSPVRFSATIQI